jgi:hypothetical protein
VTPKSDVSTVEALKQVLLKAKTVAIPEAPAVSGLRLIFSAARHRGKDQRQGHAATARMHPAWSPQEARILWSCQ